MSFKVEYDRDKNQYRVEFGGPVAGLASNTSPTEHLPNHLPDLQNVDLPGGVPTRMDGFALFSAGGTLPAGTEPTLMSRLYPSSGAAPIYVFAGRDGIIYNWTGTAFATLRLGLSTATSVWWSWTQLSDYLIISNPTDGNFKYDGTRLIPLGAKPIANMNVTNGEATWAGSGVTETTTIREGIEARKLTSTGAAVSMTLTPATAWNLTTGLLQATAYTTSDYINFQVNINDTTKLDTATTYIRFGDVADANYFQLTAAGWGTLVNGWNQVHVLKSAFAITLAPDWATIAKMTITTDATGANTVVTIYDDVYMIYASVMPACQIMVTWKNMAIGMSTTANPSDFHFSKVSGPDEWNASAVFPISQNDGQDIRGAHAFYNQIVIGKDNSVHTVGGSVAGTVYPNYRLDHILVTTEHGCSSHRSMVEAGNKIYMVWRNELHRYIGTGTEKVSYKVDPTLDDVNKARLTQIVAARYRTTNELWFTRPGAGSTTNNKLLKYNYIEDAFIPIVGAAFVLLTGVYVNGVEYLAAAEYDGDIMLTDNGTTFAGTAITSYITFPWVSAQRPDDMKMWDEVEVLYETNTGSLVVEYHVAAHPREFVALASTWTTAGTIDMAAVENLGRVFVGARSRWVQFRLRTVGAPFKVFFPFLIYATPLSQVY